MTTTRPVPPFQPPAGLHFEAVQSDDRDWLALKDSDRRCRARASKGVKACGAPAVLALRRPWRGNPEGVWWHYCAEHGYGHWVEPDETGTPRVMHYRTVPD